MQTIVAAGYSAYIVGGAVRNKLMSIEPRDVDIVTDAPLKDVMKIAQENGWKAVCVGAAFGVIVLVVCGKQFDIASVQNESKKLPRNGDWLPEDLARRDFTINAMAFDKDGILIDPFGGRQDIQQNLIRAVGNPVDRFNEDGLRMFRAARFSAQYEFAIEKNTVMAIENCLNKTRGVSIERIVVEIEKILIATDAKRGLKILIESELLNQKCRAMDNKKDLACPILPELVSLSGLQQNPAYHQLDVLEHTLETVSNIAPNLILRWAALLHDIAKGSPDVRVMNNKGQPSDIGHDEKGAVMANTILKRLRLPVVSRTRIVWLIAHHLNFPDPDRVMVLKWLRRLSKGLKDAKELRQACDQLLQLHRADLSAGHVDKNNAAMTARESLTMDLLAELPFYPAQLKISGHIIAEALGEGPIIATFQQDLLTRIQYGKLENTKEMLEKAVTAKAKRIVV